MYSLHKRENISDREDTNKTGSVVWSGSMDVGEERKKVVLDKYIHSNLI